MGENEEIRAPSCGAQREYYLENGFFRIRNIQKFSSLFGRFENGFEIRRNANFMVIEVEQVLYFK